MILKKLEAYSVPQSEALFIISGIWYVGSTHKKHRSSTQNFGLQASLPFGDVEDTGINRENQKSCNKKKLRTENTFDSGRLQLERHKKI